MLRHPVSPSQLGKWCAIALLLLAPGSFIVLPAIWLARNWHVVKKLGDRFDWGEIRGVY
jgi:hypothetical protein